MMKRLLACLLCLMLLGACAFSSASAVESEAPGRVQAMLDRLLAFQLERTGSKDVQEWISGELARNAGAGSEWNIFALSQMGEYDFSGYCTALNAYLNGAGSISHATRQKYALAMLSAGGKQAFVEETAKQTVGAQGIMTWVYGLHLLNNGVEGSVTPVQAVDHILQLQLPDGGWALRGDVSDVDVTAMTLQALAPHASRAEESIRRAVELLGKRQLETGDFVTFGAPNPESAAQVIIALAALGIDAFEDERFIKNGFTLLDVLERFQLEDGSFCHAAGGAFNANACMQTLQALVAWQRMMDGRGSLYSLQPERKANIQTAPDYKMVTAMVIAGVAIVLTLVLVITGRRHVKNFAALWLAAAALTAFVAFTDFQTAENYYSGETVVKNNPIGKITMSIRCDMALGRTDVDLPQDGVMLADTVFAIAQGDTAYSILTEAARAFGIRLDTSGPQGMVYVSGINHLYEFACGELSGWTYLINGKTSDVGCDQCKLQDGDIVEWRYTCELGNDLK